MRKVLWLLMVKLAHIDVISALHVAVPAHTSISNADGCDRDDDAQNHRWIVDHYDQQEVARLKSQGKVVNNTLSDLAFSHIPKNAGDAIQIAFYGLNTNYVDIQAVDQCFYTQLPPKELARMDPALAERTFGGKDVFCVVRDPFPRAISAACHLLFLTGHVNFTRFQVNDEIRHDLSLFRSGDYKVDVCFWVPQVHYMEGPYGCKHALDFRHIEREFNDFTHAHGYNVMLPPKGATHKCTMSCPFTKDDLDPDVQWLVKDTYREDFERLGPMFGF